MTDIPVAFVSIRSSRVRSLREGVTTVRKWGRGKEMGLDEAANVSLKTKWQNRRDDLGLWMRIVEKKQIVAG